MPIIGLPPIANLDHLKHQAKDLIKARASRDAQAAQRIREFHPRMPGADSANRPVVRKRRRPNSGMPPALPHGEFEAANALLRNGARIDLAVAATLGRVEDGQRLLVTSSSEDRHRAFALAAQFGHTEMIRLLLDPGEDPNRYNPMGVHSHSTPLHQAALAGHYEAVRLLVERGARLDLRDVWFQGTPEGWATHAGQTEIAEYLRAQDHARARSD